LIYLCICRIFWCCSRTCCIHGMYWLFNTHNWKSIR